VDQHHTVEDVGIALGEAFDRALGDKRGILRADISLCPWTRRSRLQRRLERRAFAVETKYARAGRRSATELVTDFFEGFARGAAPMFT